MIEAEDAAGLWGGTVVRPLRLRENEVYEVSLAGRRAALRLHRRGYQSADAIRSELWWCAELAQLGLPVPAALALPEGGHLAVLTGGRMASVVDWVDGAPLGEAGVPLGGSSADQATQHHTLGQLVARVHAATDGLPLPDWFTRPCWDRDGLVGEAPFWGRFWEHPALSAAEAGLLAEARAWLSERLAVQAGPMGLIHADVLRENILVNGHSLSMIDFDDSGFGYRIYDLGTVLSQNLYEPAYDDIRAALCEGYGLADTGLVDAFTLARTLASVGWAAPRLPTDSPVHASHIARAVMFAQRCLA
ncbi:MAG: phosphotransferase [Pseudotabrizicola sp.]|uniref:phosphotransferase n=1 Tax=Pseudotabrizicola sp. TaxID=2939647 RepID=UPI00273093BA|nr:phosphotransferase [Pseudotabrizicola sp.]MDP2082135.1 phosphotransferase [Pseudotabrizicola sp.]MDZ7576528.1 phosphotransferase [Pseudotabrizicola sp.]